VPIVFDHLDRLDERLHPQAGGEPCGAPGGQDVTNAYAAEHLEIQTRDAAGVSRRIRNAGAIFLGPWSPVPLGDYLAGSNHVLPTGGTARFASGLGVQAFIKSVQVVEYDRHALESLAGPLVALAESEDLPAHGQTVACRFEAR